MQLKDYVSAITRRWWLIALVVVSATACSFFFSKIQAPVYRSSVVLINTARIDWGATMTIQILLKQQEEQLKTLDIASKVNERMRLDLSPDDIIDRVKTKTYTDSITIRLDVEDFDAERARKIALGYGQIFEEEKAAEYALVTPENRVRVSMLEEPRTGVLVRPNTKMNTAAGAMLGLLLGLVLVVGLEYLDDSLKTPEDVARYLGVPTLGLIPTIPRK
ncbi:MAG TPA: Wzz/FepE/Etk N-terminal domain-containing protein [Chloroflexota bacterium]